MYKLLYDPITGEVSCIQRLSDNASIPICWDNMDYVEFEQWNLHQKTPLDLNSTIEVVPPEKPRDLAAELDIAKADIVKLKAGKMDKV